MYVIIRKEAIAYFADPPCTVCDCFVPYNDMTYFMMFEEQNIALTLRLSYSHPIPYPRHPAHGNL
jgi:hypothetical protein